MLGKRKNDEPMNDKEYAKYLEKNGMIPSDETLEAADSSEDDEPMSDEDYEKHLIKNGMKPGNYEEA